MLVPVLKYVANPQEFRVSQASHVQRHMRRDSIVSELDCGLHFFEPWQCQKTYKAVSYIFGNFWFWWVLPRFVKRVPLGFACLVHL